jgi:hypothetical protein
VSSKHTTTPDDAGTIDSDDIIFDNPTAATDVDLSEQASTSAQPYKPSQPVRTSMPPEKSSDNLKTIIEQNRVINSRPIAIEEKLDHIHRIVDLSYKSTPVTPTMGPRTGVVNVTRW